MASLFLLAALLVLRQQHSARRAAAAVQPGAITELLRAALGNLQQMVAAAVGAERAALARLALQARAVLASQAALVARLAQVARLQRLVVPVPTALEVVAVVVERPTTGPLVLVALEVLELKTTINS